MHRLTEYSDIGITNYLISEIGCSNSCNMCSIGTKDCIIAKHMVERLAIIEEIFGDDYDIGYIREMVKADREGRCFILTEEQKRIADEMKKTGCLERHGV